MKNLAFIFLLLFTWYLAVMYRLENLMVLSIAEMMIYISMLICTWYYKRNIESGFLQKYGVSTREEYTECSFWIENKGILPISHVRVRFSYFYEGEEYGKSIVFDGQISGRKRSQAKVKLETPWNGLLFICMDEINAYDYLSLFKTKIRLWDEMEMAMIPPDCGEILLELSGRMRADHQNINYSFQKNSDDFMQLREYRQGDSLRLIHWKQSARMEMLWVKEYQDEQKKSVWLCLDFYGYQKKSLEEISVFYEILWTLLRCFWNNGYRIQLVWKQKRGGRRKQILEREESGMTAFTELYKKNWSEEKSRINLGGTGMRLRFGVDLNLWLNKEKNYIFTKEHYKEELEELRV